MKPIYETTKLEHNRAKLREIQQQLRGLQMQILTGGQAQEKAKEYSRLRLEMDVCTTAIATYEAEEGNRV